MLYTESFLFNNPSETVTPGIPGWLRGEESAYQSRRRGLSPCSENVPHDSKQLRLFTTAESVL